MLLYRCDFLKKHEVKITDVHLNASGMLLCTYTGEVFTAQVQGSVKTFGLYNFCDKLNFNLKKKVTISIIECAAGKAKDDFVKVSHRSKEETKECYLVKLMRIQNAHRSIRVFSEPSCSNFGLLKVPCSKS